MNKFVIFIGFLALIQAYDLVPCPTELPKDCGCDREAVCVLFKEGYCSFGFCGKTFDNACKACYEHNVY